MKHELFSSPEQSFIFSAPVCLSQSAGLLVLEFGTLTQKALLYKGIINQNAP